MEHIWGCCVVVAGWLSGIRTLNTCCLSGQTCIIRPLKRVGNTGDVGGAFGNGCGGGSVFGGGGGGSYSGGSGSESVVLVEVVIVVVVIVIA